MSKKPSIVFIISYVIFALTGMFIIYVNLFMAREKQFWMYYGFPVSNYLLFALAVFLSLGLFFLMRKIDISSPRIIKRFGLKIFFVTVIVFIIQMIIVNNIFFYIDWDVKYLKEAAFQYLSGGMNDFYTNYFEVNPNNVCMLSITVFFLKIGQVFNINGYMLLVYFGVLLNSIAILFTALSVRKLTYSDAKSFVAYFIAFVFFGLSHWLIAPYTDTYSVTIPVLTFYIFLSVRDRRMNWFVKVLSVVILSALAYMIKPTNIFILLAIGIYEVVMLLREKNKVETALKIVSAMILTFVIIFIMKHLIYYSINYKENEYVQKPFAHYMLLGSNEGMVGMYSTVDDEYTNSFEGMDKKSEGDFRLIRERYANMGVDGYIKHLSRKTYLNYANGLFGWGKEQLFVNEIESSDTSFGKFLQDIYYVGGEDLLIEENSFKVGGNYFSYYACACQIVWYIILLMSVVKSIENILIEVKHNNYIGIDRTKAVLAVTLIGTFVFLSVFETNARYLFSFLPLYVVYISSKSYKNHR